MTDLAMRNVLLVEDNDDDAELTRLGFARAKVPAQLHRVAHGEECLAFLRREGRHADAPAPDLILLDLNMPRMGGLEVLREIIEDARLQHLVVVVLTSSKADEDVLQAYKLRCSSYLVKPIRFEAFERMIESFGQYWFSLVRLPPTA